MRESNAAHLALLVSNVHAGATQDNVEIHTVDTDGGVVFDTQINVFLDTETEVAVLTEVFTTQLVFTDLKLTLENEYRKSREIAIENSNLVIV